MKKFNEFKNNSLSQSKLRQMYGGGNPTGPAGDIFDYIDDSGKTTNTDGSSASDTKVISNNSTETIFLSIDRE